MIIAAQYQIYKANVELPPIKVTNEAEIEEIIKNTIYLVSGLSFNQYTIKTRKRGIVQIRQLFYYLMRKYTRYTFKELGTKTTSSDHATVIHSVNTIADYLIIKEKTGYENSFTKTIESCINILDSKIKLTWQRKQKQ